MILDHSSCSCFCPPELGSTTGLLLQRVPNPLEKSRTLLHVQCASMALERSSAFIGTSSSKARAFTCAFLRLVKLDTSKSQHYALYMRPFIGLGPVLSTLDSTFKNPGASFRAAHPPGEARHLPAPSPSPGCGGAGCLSPEEGEPGPGHKGDPECSKAREKPGGKAAGCAYKGDRILPVADAC